MEGIMSSDIFFFITSVAVVVVTASVIVVTVYVVRILKDVKNFSGAVSEEGKKVVTDIDALRESFRSEGGRVLGVLGSIFNLFKFTSKSKKQKHEKTNKKDE